MTQIIPELNQSIDRVIVIASDRHGLKNIFEGALFELTTEMAPKQKLNLRVAAPQEGPIQAYAAFNLGIRAKMDARIHLLGYSLDSAPPHQRLIEECEGIILYFPDSDKNIDKFLSWPGRHHLAQKAVCLFSVHESRQMLDLRMKAFYLWTDRHLNRVLKLKRDHAAPFQEALEWVLSF